VLADDVQTVLEATVPERRRALLVGHSLGAMGIVWAGRHPYQVCERALGAALPRSRRRPRSPRALEAVAV
jgi:pimeloyl-ACP methyl ester carboxylesterase